MTHPSSNWQSTLHTSREIFCSHNQRNKEKDEIWQVLNKKKTVNSINIRWDIRQKLIDNWIVLIEDLKNSTEEKLEIIWLTKATIEKIESILKVNNSDFLGFWQNK